MYNKLLLIYAAGALCPLINPEHKRTSSLILKGDDPGDKQTWNSNRLNRSCELRHPAIIIITIKKG